MPPHKRERDHPPGGKVVSDVGVSACRVIDRDHHAGDGECQLASYLLLK